MNTYPDIPSLRVALSREMKRHTLTQRDICERTGITQPAISLFLNEHRGLSGDYALKLANLASSLEAFPNPIPPEEVQP